MQVGADDLPLQRSFGAVLAIVPGADDDLREGLRRRSEVCLSRVILEADERTFPIGEDVADEARLPRDGMDVKQAEPLELRPFEGAIEMAEELVAAADRQDRGTAIDRGAQRVAVRAAQILGD